MTKKEGEEDPSELIYDLLECFMMTWKEFMSMTSTAGYDIWSEDTTETQNYPTSTFGGRFKPQPNYPTSTNGGRHFKPQSNGPVSTYGGDISNPK